MIWHFFSVCTFAKRCVSVCMRGYVVWEECVMTELLWPRRCSPLSWVVQLAKQNNRVREVWALLYYIKNFSCLKWAYLTHISSFLQLDGFENALLHCSIEILCAVEYTPPGSYTDISTHIANKEEKQKYKGFKWTWAELNIMSITKKTVILNVQWGRYGQKCAFSSLPEVSAGRCNCAASSLLYVSQDFTVFSVINKLYNQ